MGVYEGCVFAGVCECLGAGVKGLKGWCLWVLWAMVERDTKDGWAMHEGALRMGVCECLGPGVKWFKEWCLWILVAMGDGPLGIGVCVCVHVWAMGEGDLGMGVCECLRPGVKGLKGWVSVSIGSMGERVRGGDYESWWPGDRVCCLWEVDILCNMYMSLLPPGMDNWCGNWEQGFKTCFFS